MNKRKSNVYDSVSPERLRAYIGEWSGEFYERFKKGEPTQKQRFEILIDVAASSDKELRINAKLSGRIKRRLVHREVELKPTKIGHNYFRMDFDHKDKGQDHFGAFLGTVDPEVDSACGSYVSWGWDEAQDAMGTFMITHVFRRAMHLTELWKPIGCRTERQYQESLLKCLKKRLVGVNVSNERRKPYSRVDILIGKQTQLELKYNLERQTEYDRLVGQMGKVEDTDGFFIAVLTGLTANRIAEQLDKRVRKLNNESGRTRFAVVCKAS